MPKIQVDKCFFLPEKGFNWRTYRSSFQTPTGYSIASSSTISCQRTVDCSTSVSETCVYLVQTDKASMLEEIIEYVKFLQLQVREGSLTTTTIPLFHAVWLTILSSADLYCLSLIEGSQHEQAGHDGSRRPAPDGVPDRGKSHHASLNEHRIHCACFLWLGCCWQCSASVAFSCPRGQAQAQAGNGQAEVACCRLRPGTARRSSTRWHSW